MTAPLKAITNILINQLVGVVKMQKNNITKYKGGRLTCRALWKEGKYDEAVLDAMGLKWDGDVIVEERKL